MQRFLEKEAELGSDNEDNDDNCKEINREDNDELDNSSLDGSLKDFVDEEPEEGDEEAAMLKYND